jgi:hypothetical protein
MLFIPFASNDDGCHLLLDLLGLGCEILVMVPSSGGRRKKLEGGHTSKKKICIPQIVINVWQINNI